jgi:small nuclear ribonucleoprotein (snRNP)-like protein
MNLVLDDAEEVDVKKKTRKSLGAFSVVLVDRAVVGTGDSRLLRRCPCCHKIMVVHSFCLEYTSFTGRILLKGDNITLMMTV